MTPSPTRSYRRISSRTARRQYRLASPLEINLVLLLVGFYLTLTSAKTRTCSLENVAVENIQIDPQSLVEGVDRHRRINYAEGNVLTAEEPLWLRGDKPPSSLDMLPAIAVLSPNGRELQNDIDDGNSDALTTFQGRKCDCATYFISSEDEFFCPLTTDHCSIWTGRYGESHKFRVSCSKMGWKVGYSRYVWYYLVFAFSMLAMYLFCSRPGHHAAKYLLSFCCPKMNTWITEQVLKMELDQRDRIREESLYAVHMKRRTIGWISGYKLKTKRYLDEIDHATKASPKSAVAGGSGVDTLKASPASAVVGEIGVDNSCKELDPALTMITPTSTSFIDCNMDDEDECLCTICILPIENGDRVADLKCGHIYHVDCLSEWILKKNACPLCQDPNVAEEVRTFETEEEFRRSLPNSRRVEQEDSPSGRFDWAWGRFVEMATGWGKTRNRQISSALGV